ncbi:aspartyl protease family protein 2-like [Cucurbita pepo subsp. pepo]|uniref:aspartyl protease family protein 2-like n=1 Tax=Cucurbita pepo subsp. pepo TaxID=3664 RepID=UPI000C9D99D9|nr:aspartyl protease family protein 2-like [Cucurbita pepo subsp. pepo]
MNFLGKQSGSTRGFQNCSVYLALIFLLLSSGVFDTIAEAHVRQGFNESNRSGVFGIELPENISSGIASSSASAPCSFSNEDEEEEERLMANSLKKSVKLHLKKRSTSRVTEPKESITESAVRDLARIQTLHKRITERKNQDTTSRLKNGNAERRKPAEAVSPAASPDSYSGYFSGQLMATLESGVSLGSGEYFIDVFVGSPPKHFSLILDTGSDLNWIQCVPCHDCFEQTGPYYDPKDSISFRNITCSDRRCQLVSSPDPPQPCKSETQSCPYFYWYGDSSNTTGDFALETFTVNLTSSTTRKSEFRRVENVMFGCGHWNRGLFHGAAGLLGLGRGPLSFSSQLQSLYGHSFSYCLVDRNSDTSVSSKLIFGEDRDLLTHPELKFTSLIGGKENPVDTFYYLQIKSIFVGGEKLQIPEETWNISADGAGGTIIDSGTTLSYFSDPAYRIIKEAFLRKVKNYKLVEDFPILHPCYNVSSADKLEFPEFEIQFADGTVWKFPVENYFIRIEQFDMVCLAMLGTPKSALSIIGNYQQQNFHILYDTKNSRLGFAPMRCADGFTERGAVERTSSKHVADLSQIIECKMVSFRFHQYQVVGRALPSEADEHPKIYRMKLWATNEVRAKSKFWYFLRKLKKVKKSNGQVLAINEIFEKNPTKIKNYGIWLRYQSRTGYHNMYKEFRDTTLNGGVEQMYNEMASRHRVRCPCIQIIKTATVPAKLCKRESTKQFHDSKIKFPLVFKKVRPPTRKLKTTYKASKPNLFM